MKALIAQALAETFDPSYLKITDDSHQHHGHSGNPTGAGNTHFSVELTAASFEDKPLVARHKMVYACLDQWMNSPIHALSLKLNP